MGTTDSMSDADTTGALRHQLDDQRDEMGRTLEAIGDRVSPRRMVERGKDATTGRVTRAVRSARERVIGSLPGDDTVGGTASGIAGSAGGKMQSAEGAMLDTARSNAIAAGAVAMGVGFVAAMAFPRSRAEQRAADRMQPQLERAATGLGKAEGEMVEDLKPMIQDGVESVKQTATAAAGQ